MRQPIRCQFTDGERYVAIEQISPRMWPFRSRGCIRLESQRAGDQDGIRSRDGEPQLDATR